MNDSNTHWGIIGTGGIARSMAQALALAGGAATTAVLSRSAEKADAFAREFGASNTHTNLEAFCADSAFDIAYVATPHPNHHAETLACLRAGKHVLCEKPMALNTAQAAEMIATAREHGRFLMEAMWMYCFPAIRDIRKRLAAGELGEITSVRAGFNINVPCDPQHRLYNKALGGGALLDLGIYPLSFAQLALGLEPVEVKSVAHMGETGVDEHAVLALRYANGANAALDFGMRGNCTHTASITGRNGTILMPQGFFHPDRFTLARNDGAHETHTFETCANGLAHEAAEVNRCIREGLTESPLRTHAETLAAMRIMDRIRKDWGLVYDGE